MEDNETAANKIVVVHEMAISLIKCSHLFTSNKTLNLNVSVKMLHVDQRILSKSLKNPFPVLDFLKSPHPLRLGLMIKFM